MYLPALILTCCGSRSNHKSNHNRPPLYSRGSLRFLFSHQPSQTRAVRTWSTWILRLWWSPKTASPSPSSWWPPHGKRRQPGPVTLARHVCSHQITLSDPRSPGQDLCLLLTSCGSNTVLTLFPPPPPIFLSFTLYYSA